MKKISIIFKSIALLFVSVLFLATSGCDIKRFHVQDLPVGKYNYVKTDSMTSMDEIIPPVQIFIGPIDGLDNNVKMTSLSMRSGEYKPHYQLSAYIENRPTLGTTGDSNDSDIQRCCFLLAVKTDLISQFSGKAKDVLAQEIQEGRIKSTFLLKPDITKSTNTKAGFSFAGETSIHWEKINIEYGFPTLLLYCNPAYWNVEIVPKLEGDTYSLIQSLFDDKTYLQAFDALVRRGSEAEQQLREEIKKRTNKDDPEYYRLNRALEQIEENNKQERI